LTYTPTPPRPWEIKISVVVLKPGDLVLLAGGGIKHKQINVLAMGDVVDQHVLCARYLWNVGVVLKQVPGQLTHAFLRGLIFEYIPPVALPEV